MVWLRKLHKLTKSVYAFYVLQERVDRVTGLWVIKKDFKKGTDFPSMSGIQ